MQEDKIRLERKINKYMNYGGSQKGETSSITQFTSEKIKNLQKFLENVESESNMSESDFENSMQYYNRKSNSKNGSENLKKQNKKHDDNSDYKEREQKRIQKIEEQESQMETYNKLANDLTVTRLELDEANKTIEVLKEVVSKEQKKCIDQESQLREFYEKTINTQKEDLEAVIERHLQFIDQLILDKKELNTQVETLTDELKNIEEKYSTITKDLKEKHLKDLKANKEAWMAAEKQRKEKWMNEKTNEIKEVTIKGLEPEIERIINRNKVEIKKLEDKHQKMLNELRESVQEEYEQKFRAHKDKVMMDTEDIISKQNSYQSQKTKDQIQRIEQNYQEDRERMKQYYEQEIKKLEDKRREEKEELINSIKEKDIRYLEEIKQLTNQLNSSNEERKQEAKYKLQQQREQIKIEQEKWMEKQIQKQNDDIAKKTQEIRKKLEKERDFQIEVVINKIAEDNQNMEKQLESKYQQKLSQIQQEHRSEIKELKRELSYYEDQNAQTSVSKNKIQENIETLSKRLVEVQQNLEKCEKENKNLKKDNSDLEAQLLSQKNLLKIHEENIRREMALEIQKLHDQILVSNKLLSEMSIDHTIELEKAEEQYSKQLEGMEERVKGILLKKDQQIARLKEEIKYKEQTCSKLEQLLEKQRRDLVQKINNS